MRWPFATKTGLAMDITGPSASPSTRFAFKLFRQLASEQENRNLFWSPASVMLCLWMLHDGATGHTREAMATVLEVAGLDREAMQLDFVALKSALHPYGPGLLFEAANSLWCSQEQSPRSEYVAKVKEHYDAEVVVLDFHDPHAAARVNSWVSATTRGKIESILSTIDPFTALLAINAIYFKGLWGVPFERELTHTESFHTSDGRTLRVPLMCQCGYYLYHEESKFQAIGLRYKGGLTMYLFLPAKTSNLKEFQQNLAPAVWDQWMGRFKGSAGQIGLPRFTLTYGANLKGALDKLGMGIAFDPRRARFDTIHPPPPELWISQIFHQAFVEVNEEGTEAAAITDATEYFSSEEPSPRSFEMIVDRPFFLAICDNHTHTVLFMGSVEEPSS
jgi:serine protease inhibitor